MLSPTASLRALQSPLQAIGRLASDFGNELLTGPLFYQLPRELTQVRPDCPGQGQEQRQRSFWPQPTGLWLLSPRLFLLVQAFGGVTVAEFSSRYGPGQRKSILKQFEQGKIQL